MHKSLGMRIQCRHCWNMIVITVLTCCDYTLHICTSIKTLSSTFTGSGVQDIKIIINMTVTLREV